MNELKFNDSSGLGFIGFVMVLGMTVSFMVAGVVFGIRSASVQASNLNAVNNAIVSFHQLGEETIVSRQDAIATVGCSGGRTAVDSMFINDAFCMPASGGAVNLCISNPAAPETPNGEPNLSCSTGQNPILVIDPSLGYTNQSQHRIQTKDEMYATVHDNNYKSNKLLSFLKDKIAYFNQAISAQKVFDNYDFAGAPAPAAEALTTSCAAATGICKSCSANGGDLGNPDMVTCMQFRICPLPGGCPDDADWMIQNIGVLQPM